MYPPLQFVHSIYALLFKAWSNTDLSLKSFLYIYFFLDLSPQAFHNPSLSSKKKPLWKRFQILAINFSDLMLINQTPWTGFTTNKL